MLGRRRENVPVYPFVVDDITRANLGSAGLEDLAIHLWPHECQTCGGNLNGTRPAVRVKAWPDMATADLHHPDCLPARWEDTTTTSSASPSTAATLNFVSRALLLPIIGERTGAEALRPFLLVNPGLEQVILAEREGYWRVATTDYYARYGLSGGGSMLRIDFTIPNAIASLDPSDNVTVLLGDLRAGWTGECDPELAAYIRELGGTVVAVSTAFHPALDSILTDFADAIAIGQVAGGWVPLTA